MSADSTARRLQPPALLAVVGADLALERVLAAAVGASMPPGTEVRLTDDITTCSVLVAVDGSAFAGIALRAVQARPGVRAFRCDAHGHLRDAASLDADGDATRPSAVGPSGESDATAEIHATVADVRARVLARDGCTVVAVGGQPRLLLDFERGLAGTLAGSDASLSPQALADALVSGRLAPADGMSAVTVVPLLPLLWRAAIALAPGGQLPAHRPGVALTLRSWPDFRALAHRHDHFRLSCLLLGKPMRAARAAVLSGMEEGEVLAFLGAAWLTGHADLDAPSPGKPPAGADHDAGAAAPQRASLFARLWRSVRGAAGSSP